MLIVISVTWLVPTVVFFTSIIGWQYFVGIRTVPPGMCYVQYMEDAIFNMLLQVGYFWITLTVMCSLYAGIYRVALRLQQKSEAKQRKMASLVSVAGKTISKIGIGVTQPHHHSLQQPASAPSDHQRLQQQQQQPQFPPHSNGNSCRGDGAADGLRSTPSQQHRSTIHDCRVMSDQNAAPAADGSVAVEASTKATGTTPKQHQDSRKCNKSQQRRQKQRQLLSSPDRSSSSVALSSDSDGAGGTRRERKDHPKTAGAVDAQSKSPTSNVKHGRSSASHWFRRSSLAMSGSSPVTVVEKAVQYVNARRLASATAAGTCSATDDDDHERCSDDDQRCRRLVPTKSPIDRDRRLKYLGGEINWVTVPIDATVQHSPVDSCRLQTSGEKVMQRKSPLSLAKRTLASVGGFENRTYEPTAVTLAVNRYRYDGNDSDGAMRHSSAAEPRPPIWEHRSRCSNYLRSDLTNCGARRSPSPVWVRRATSDGRIDQRSPTPPPLDDDVTHSGFACDWATCRAGIGGIHRRRPRRLGASHAANCSFALRRTRTVDFRSDDDDEKTIGTTHVDRHFGGCGGYFSTTSLTSFDIRSPFSGCYGGAFSRQHPATDNGRPTQRQRLRVPDVPFDFLQPSRWHRPARVLSGAERHLHGSGGGGRHQRRRNQLSSCNEKQCRRKTKGARNADDDDDDDDRVTDGRSIASSIVTKRKRFFLAAAAAAFQRRMIGSSSSARSRFRRRGTRSGELSSPVAAPENRCRASTMSSGGKTENRALKALRTITIILGAFAICFTPWHVLSLIMGFCGGQTCFSPILYDISYWLCYLNSPINPFCYAFANQQFKKAFLRIIRLDWHRT